MRGLQGNRLLFFLVTYFSKNLHKRCKLLMAGVNSVFFLDTMKKPDEKPRREGQDK
jgi:hypothetical protein